MITNLKKKQLNSLWYFLRSHVQSDFYLTKNNRRVFITELKTFRSLLSQSNNILVHEEKDINGVMMIWSGDGGDTKRRYIKFNAIDARVVDRLLTILLWNVNTDLFVKIEKYSPFIYVFKDKNFRFAHGRGKEILLHYKYRKRKYGSKNRTIS